MRRAGIAALLALLGFLFATALDAGGFVDRLEAVALDARFRSGVGRAAPGSDVVVAWIDQQSMDFMQENGVPFPWPREVYGQVLQYLRAQGARAVVFDVLFDQHGNAADDRAFAAALAEPGGDALAMKFVGYRSGGRDAEEDAAFAARALALDPAPLAAARARERGLLLPLPELAAGADALGFVNIRADADGTYRHYDLLRLWGRDGEPAAAHPSLALAAAIAAGRGAPLQWDDATTLRSIERRVPCRGGRMLLNLRGPAFTFPRIKFVNLLTSINRAEAGEAPLHDANAFRDKIVLVGIHADGYEDAHPTPLDPHLPGVELHATALDNLLRADAIATTAPGVARAASAGAAVLAAATVFALPGVVWPAVALALLALLGAGSALWAWASLLAVPVAAPAVAGAATAGGAFLWRLLVEGRQKRELHRAFRSYLAPEVLDEVLRDPAALRLGGETRDVTLLFTDLEGFTALAEHTEPQQLVAFLNDYFTRMCAPVLAERGIIDKFIGDAIMAIFGAPASTPAHGGAAVRAALRALAVSDAIAAELRARGLPAIATRIGIHRGLAVVGNMGSATRFDYTAIGDTVNLAARLEGANKHFGTRCLVSATAWADGGTEVLGREIGRLRVVGRAEPIAVFEPLAAHANATEPLLAFTEEWRAAVASVRAGDVQAAAVRFDACERLRPGDPLLAKWRTKLREPGFDGVFVLDHK
jgi:adenylate cyclase